MRKHKMLFALLLISVAISSALIGLVIGRGAGERGQQLMEQSVSGEDIGFGPDRRNRTIRFYEGPRIAAQFAYWLEGNLAGDRFLVSCCNRRSQVVFSVYYTRSGANVHSGMTRSSPIKYHLEGGTVYVGPNNKGPALWSRCGGGDDLCGGKGEQGARIYHVERGRVYAGPRVTTEVLLTADENIEHDPIVMLLVPLLIQRDFEQW